jgi:hypothetical protein
MGFESGAAIEKWLWKHLIFLNRQSMTALRAVGSGQDHKAEETD